MTFFIALVTVVLSVWALCSLAEAALYAVSDAYVRQMQEAGTLAGRILAGFKRNMEQPISAILIINTAVSAAGASIAGAQARLLFGETALLVFSLTFTLAALFLSEIAPKIFGVAYARFVARAMAVPVAAAIAVLFPITWFVQRVSRLIGTGEAMVAAPEEEVRQLAMISAEEGSIMPYEAELVRNVLGLDKIIAKDIMTPRPVVQKLPADLTLREASQQITEYTYARIPIYESHDPENWIGFVLSREVLAGLAQDQFQVQLQTLGKPLFFVSEKTQGHLLLKAFLKRRTHLFGVVDEFGGITGIVTLEDVLESLIGQEIVDELDSVVDMQELARLRKREQLEQPPTERPDAEDSDPNQ